MDEKATATSTRHGIDWPEVGKDQSGGFAWVACVCGWRSASRHSDDGAYWYSVYAHHLEDTLNAQPLESAARKIASALDIDPALLTDSAGVTHWTAGLSSVHREGDSRPPDEEACRHAASITVERDEIIELDETCARCGRLTYKIRKRIDVITEEATT